MYPTTVACQILIRGMFPLLYSVCVCVGGGGGGKKLIMVEGLMNRM